MTEVLRLHDNCERIIEESARNSLIKIRASEFSKLARIIEQYPEAHEWYKEKYR